MLNAASLKRLERPTVGGTEGGGQAASNGPLFIEIRDFVKFCPMMLVGSIVIVLTPTKWCENNNFCCSFQSSRALRAGSLTYLSLPTYYLRLRTACMFRIRGFWGGDSLFWEEKHFQGGKSVSKARLHSAHCIQPPASGMDTVYPHAGDNEGVGILAEN